MSRIKATFDELRSGGRKGFIPFVTAGDPDIAASEEIVLALAEAGADIIELGVPFSDPMADGPTIQASSQRALVKGTRLVDILELVSRLRKRTAVPIVLFSYLNPLFRFGIERLTMEAASAGIEGILITDAIDNEAAAIADTLRGQSIDLISLIAPTTSDERLDKIVSNSSGFLYAVSRAGMTGARGDTSTAAEALVNRARALTDIPIAVGFGISTREQIRDVWRYADAAVVGSAIVAEIAKAADPGDAVRRVRLFVAELLPSVANTAVET